jgi:hypothetical protein
VLVTAGDEGAAYCFKGTKGEHSGFVPVFKVRRPGTGLELPGRGQSGSGLRREFADGGSTARRRSSPSPSKQ